MYWIVMRGCWALAIGLAIVWGTAVWVARLDGSDGIEVSPVVDLIAVATIASCVIVGTSGWLTLKVVRAEHRAQGAGLADLVADRVATALAGELVDRLTPQVAKSLGLVVASKVSKNLHAYIAEDLRPEVETWLGRAHTRGMIDEAATSRLGNGTVASIRRND